MRSENFHPEPTLLRELQHPDEGYLAALFFGLTALLQGLLKGSEAAELARADLNELNSYGFLTFFSI